MTDGAMSARAGRLARMRRAAFHPCCVAVAALALSLLGLIGAGPALSVVARLEAGMSADHDLSLWLGGVAVIASGLALLSSLALLGRPALARTWPLPLPLLGNPALDACDRAAALEIACRRLQAGAKLEDACSQASADLRDPGAGGAPEGQVALEAHALSQSLQRGEIAPAPTFLGPGVDPLFAAAARAGAAAAVIEALAEHEALAADASVDDAIQRVTTRALVLAGVAVLFAALAFFVPYAQVFGRGAHVVMSAPPAAAAAGGSS